MSTDSIQVNDDHYISDFFYSAWHRYLRFCFYLDTFSYSWYVVPKQESITEKIVIKKRSYYFHKLQCQVIGNITRNSISFTEYTTRTHS